MAYTTMVTEDRVAVLTMDCRGENRFHPDFIDELHSRLDEVEHDDALGALVVTGANPKFWSNGLDLEWIMAHAGDATAILQYLGKVNGLFRRVTLFPKPTVAALNGHTFAAGLFLAAHMDFRFMREDRGWICLPEVDINIPLLPGMIAICEAVMTPPGFRRLYYTGERFGGPQAVEMGFADGVFAADELLPSCVAFAAQLATKRTATYAEMKRRIRGDIDRILDEVDPELFLATLGFAMPR